VRVKGETKKIWEKRWITPDNAECPDRITRHSEVALALFVDIADDLPVTGHRLSRTVRDTDATRSMVEVFAVARFCARGLEHRVPGEIDAIGVTKSNTPRARSP
jgi:hypothetical protein